MSMSPNFSFALRVYLAHSLTCTGEITTKLCGQQLHGTRSRQEHCERVMQLCRTASSALENLLFDVERSIYIQCWSFALAVVDRTQEALRYGIAAFFAQTESCESLGAASDLNEYSGRYYSNSLIAVRCRDADLAALLTYAAMVTDKILDTTEQDRLSPMFMDTAEETHREVKAAETEVQAYAEGSLARRVGTEGVRYERLAWACEAIDIALSEYQGYFDDGCARLRVIYCSKRFILENIAVAARAAAKCAHIVERRPALTCVAPGITAYYGHVATQLLAEYKTYQASTVWKSNQDQDDFHTCLTFLDIRLLLLEQSYEVLDKLSDSRSGASAPQPQWKSLPAVKAVARRLVGELDRTVQGFARRLRDDFDGFFECNFEHIASNSCKTAAQAVLSVGHCLDPGGAAATTAVAGPSSLVAEYRAFAALYAGKVVELAGLFDISSHASWFELQRLVCCCVLLQRLADGLCADAERCRVAAQRAEDPTRRLFRQAEELFREAVDLHRAAMNVVMDARKEGVVYEDPKVALDIAEQARWFERSAQAVHSASPAVGPWEGVLTLDLPLDCDYSLDVARSRSLMEGYRADMGRALKLPAATDFADSATMHSLQTLLRGVRRLLRPVGMLLTVPAPGIADAALSALLSPEQGAPPALDADCAWLGRAAVNVLQWVTWVAQNPKDQHQAVYKRHLRRIQVEMREVLRDAEKKRGLAGEDIKTFHDGDEEMLRGLRMKVLMSGLDDGRYPGLEGGDHESDHGSDHGSDGDSQDDSFDGISASDSDGETDDVDDGIYIDGGDGGAEAGEDDLAEDGSQSAGHGSESDGSQDDSEEEDSESEGNSQNGGQEEDARDGDDDVDEDEKEEEEEEEEEQVQSVSPEPYNGWGDVTHTAKEAKERAQRDAYPDPCACLAGSKAVVAALFGAMRALRAGDPEAAVRWEALVWYAGQFKEQPRWESQVYQYLVDSLTGPGAHEPSVGRNAATSPNAQQPPELRRAGKAIDEAVRQERQRAKVASKLLGAAVGDPVYALSAAGDQAFQTAREIMWYSVDVWVCYPEGSDGHHEPHCAASHAYYHAAAAQLEGRSAASQCWATAAQLHRLAAGCMYCTKGLLGKRTIEGREQHKFVAATAAERFARAAERFDARNETMGLLWRMAAQASADLLTGWRETDKYSGSHFALVEPFNSDAKDYAAYLAEAAIAAEQRQRLSGSDSEGWVQAEERCKLWEQVVALQKEVVALSRRHDRQGTEGDRSGGPRKKGSGAAAQKAATAKLEAERQHVKVLVARTSRP